MAVILLFFLLAVSCISRKVPEAAANKEEIDGDSPKLEYLNPRSFFWTNV